MHFEHWLSVLRAFTLTEPAEFRALKVPGLCTENGQKMQCKTMGTTRPKRAPSWLRSGRGGALRQLFSLESWLTDASQITSTIIAGYNNCYLIEQYLFLCNFKKSKRENAKRCTLTYKTRPSVELAGGSWRTDLWVKGLHIFISQCSIWDNTNTATERTTDVSALYCSVLRKVFGNSHTYRLKAKIGAFTALHCSLYD